MRTSKATRSLTGKLLRPLVAVAVWAMVVSPALAIDLFNPGIPPFPDGLSPTFNTVSFDFLGFRYHYSSRSGAHGKILVNRKNNGTGAWTYYPSKVAVDMTLYDTNTNPKPSVALGNVLRSGGPAYDFLNPSDSTRYRYIMYFIYQGTRTPGLAGVVCVAYSQNALDWTDPIYAIHKVSNYQSYRGRRCGVDSADVFNVNAEAVSGFLNPVNTLHLWNLEGNLSLVQTYTGNPSVSLTYYSTTNPDRPDVLERQGMITLNGVDNLNRPGGTYYNYFPNLDTTYDPATGWLYLARAYPAPFDPDDLTTPCNGLLGNYTTVPSHGQIYGMKVDGEMSKSISSSSTWTKIAELGQFTGHTAEDQAGVCTAAVVRTCIPVNEYFYNAGNRPNLNMVSLHKTPRGLASPDSQGRLLLYLQLVNRADLTVGAVLEAGRFSTVQGGVICMTGY